MSNIKFDDPMQGAQLLSGINNLIPKEDGSEFQPYINKLAALGQQASNYRFVPLADTSEGLRDTYLNGAPQQFTLYEMPDMASGGERFAKGVADVLLSTGSGALGGAAVGGGIFSIPTAIVGGVLGLGKGLISAIGNESNYKKQKAEYNSKKNLLDFYNDQAQRRYQNGLVNMASEVNEKNNRSYLAQNPFLAYGGPIWSMADVKAFSNDSGLKNFQIQKEVQLNRMYPNRFAEGGQMQDYNMVGAKSIDAGGTHETNPNGGVQMGMDGEGRPNLVEQGEVIWEDYVFSNRLKPSEDFKKRYGFSGDTFADTAKDIMDEAKERPNDPVVKRTVKENLLRLQYEQEQERARKQEEEKQQAIDAEDAAMMEQMLQQQAQEQAMADLAQQGMMQQGMEQQDPYAGMMPMEQMEQVQQVPEANIHAYGDFLESPDNPPQGLLSNLKPVYNEEGKVTGFADQSGILQFDPRMNDYVYNLPEITIQSERMTLPTYGTRDYDETVQRYADAIGNGEMTWPQLYEAAERNYGGKDRGRFIADVRSKPVMNQWYEDMERNGQIAAAGLAGTVVAPFALEAGLMAAPIVADAAGAAGSTPVGQAIYKGMNAMNALPGTAQWAALPLMSKVGNAALGATNIITTAGLSAEAINNAIKIENLDNIKSERPLTIEEQGEYDKLKTDNKALSLTLALDGALNLVGGISTKGFQRPLLNKAKRYKRRTDGVEKMFNYMTNNPKEAEKAYTRLDNMLNNETRLKELFGNDLNAVLGDDVAKIGTKDFDLSKLDWSKADWSKLNRDALNKLYDNLKVTEDGIAMFGNAPKGKKYISTRKADAIETLEQTRNTQNTSNEKVTQIKNQIVEEGLASKENVDDVYKEVIGIKDRIRESTKKVENLTKQLADEIPNRKLDKNYNDVPTKKEKRLRSKLEDAQAELDDLQSKNQRYKNIVDMNPQGLVEQEKSLKEAQKTIDKAYAQSGNMLDRYWMLQSGQTPNGKWLPWAKIGTNTGAIGLKTLLNNTNNNIVTKDNTDVNAELWRYYNENRYGGYIKHPNQYDWGGKLLEYAPILLQTGQVLADDLGWTNTPDYSNANMLAGEMRRLRPRFMTYEPLKSPKMTYTPVDVNVERNAFDAKELGLLKTAGVLNGGARALADAARHQAFGEMQKNIEERNRKRLNDVMAYNLGIDRINQANAQAIEERNMAAADAYNKDVASWAKQIFDARQAEDLAAASYHAQNRANLSELISGYAQDSRNFNRRKQNLIASGEYINLQPSELAYLGFTEEEIKEAQRRKAEMEKEKNINRTTVPTNYLFDSKPYIPPFYRFGQPYNSYPSRFVFSES